MMARETAWRMFSGELNASTFEKKGNDEKSPSYVISPLGAVVNRVMITGVLTDKENKGSEEEPMWNGRIQDVVGQYYISVGKFQPEAASAMADLEAPCFVAVIGKVRTYTTNDGRVFISLRPERITQIDEQARNQWVLEASKSMWNRLLRMKVMYSNPDITAEELIKQGFTAQEAEGMITAVTQYGLPESAKYLKAIQAALRIMLPNEDVDLGLPENESDLPDEMNIPSSSSSTIENAEDANSKEDILLRILEELDDNPRGAPRDEIDRRAAAEGISSDEVEEISNSLMDKGLVYEPNLGYLKKI